MKNSYYFSRGWSIVVMVAVFTIMLLSTSVSMATNYTPPATTPGTPPPAVNITQPISADIDAAAKAAAAAQAASKAAAQATGGSAISAGGASDSYSANGDLINQHSSRTFVFPAPVWTQVPQAAGCFVTESQAGSLGWNFASGSKSVQFSDPICVSVRMAENARMFCHFKTAELIDQNTFRTMFPKSEPLPSTEGLRNLTLAECEEVKRPRLIMTPAIQPVTVAPPAPVSPPVATLACPVPQKPAQQPLIKRKVAFPKCPAK